MSEIQRKQRLLFVRMSAIGDVIMLGRSIRMAARHGATVCLLTHKKLLPVASGFPELKEVLLLDDALQLSGHIRTDITSPWKDASVDFLRFHREFDSVLDFQRTARSRRALRQLKKEGFLWKKRFWVNKRHLARQYLLLKARLARSQTQQRGDPQPPSHTRVVIRQLELVQKALQCAQDTQSINEYLFSAPHLEQAPAHDVLLFAGASLPLKQWDLENCREFAGEIVKSGLSLAFVGGPGEEQAGHRLAQLVPKIVNLAGQTDLSTTLGMIAQCRFVVTTDSFPGHLCDLLAKPAIVLFGATSPAFGFTPLHQKITVHHTNLKCSPCTRHGRGTCRFGNHLCMRSHNGGEIAREVIRSLSSENIRPRP